MAENDARRIPSVIAVGEICDRPEIETGGQDSIELMRMALREAEAELDQPRVGA